MVAANLNDALLALMCAKQRVVKAATGSGHVNMIDRELTAAITEVARHVRGRVPVDPTDPHSLIEQFIAAGGEVEDLYRAVEQRRIFERQERQAP